MKLYIVMVLCWLNLNSVAQDVKVSRLTVARPSENAFGAFVFDNKMYYCIDRGKKSTKKNENQGGRVFLDLFYIKLKQNNKTLGKPIRLSDTLNSNQNEGPLQISRDGKNLFYSKNLHTHKDTSTENKLGIYISEKENGVWENPIPFKYNSLDYNVANPTVNSSADMMIFSSDNPDGYGKSDLYVSYRKEDEWSEPKNLGGIINTKWSESFPYIMDNTLYFTSTREGGIGGMDLYSSKFIDGKWQKPKILEKPINSEFDDFCFFLNEDGKSGYFSSNRTGAVDGIYYFEKKIPEPINFHIQDLEFCYKVTDSIMEEAEDLEFTWDMGDGTKIKGLSVEHCYEDTGVFVTQFSVYEKSMDRTYFPAATGIVEIDPKGFPVIEFILEKNQYKFSINDKWVESPYDSYYWEIKGEKIFEPSPMYSAENLNSVRLVVWNKKEGDSIQGIELILK